MDASTRILPLFPLPLVQFPGAITPLHIFEDRYRKLLSDVLTTDKMFGIIYVGEGTEAGSAVPVEGSIGCSVEVIASQQLSDGRSNILCAGDQRFQTIRYVEGEPYLQAEVEFFNDTTRGDCDEEARTVSGLFTRVLAAGRKLKDFPVRDDATPDLPEDPESLSFLVCAYLEIDVSERLELLELRDTCQRLKRALQLLEQTASDFEQRALVNEIAKKNGHAGKLKLPDLE
jgi:Lon protease-like protein